MRYLLILSLYLKSFIVGLLNILVKKTPNLRRGNQSLSRLIRGAINKSLLVKSFAFKMPKKKDQDQRISIINNHILFSFSFGKDYFIPLKDWGQLSKSRWCAKSARVPPQPRRCAKSVLIHWKTDLMQPVKKGSILISDAANGSRKGLFIK